MRKYILTAIMICASLPAMCQQAVLHKLSNRVRRVAMEWNATPAPKRRVQHNWNGTASMCALVRCTDASVLNQHGCRSLAQWGNIHVADIPLNRLAALSQRPEVMRIEAGEPCQALVDTTTMLLGVRDTWNTPGTDMLDVRGHGVVMGIQDIGFDLTHPTFYSADGSEYRIGAFWDMLDTDTLHTQMYVGRDYTTTQELLHKAHATDGYVMTHGTHTAGIAAGSGAGSRYVGMAPEAELCLVANAVSGDSDFILEENVYKFTSATDILGFKYIFDYADRVGKPCVISFSEGAHEDLYGDAQLLYEVLDSLTGPGHILVASAGNSSVYKTYLHKPMGMDSIASYIYGPGGTAYYTLRSTDHTTITLQFSQRRTPTQFDHSIQIDTRDLLQMPDSMLVDTLLIDTCQYMLLAATYPSCYNASEWATELYIRALNIPDMGNGSNHRVLMTLRGRDQDVECFDSGGHFYDISNLPQYHNAESTHNVNFPAAAPSVIAVGGTAYRDGVYNYNGTWKANNMGTDGRLWAYSSVGPTMSGEIKPDVVAPACNIVSAYSSYYLEQNPTADDVDWDVERFEWNGRTYAWNCNTGTSMSAPIVGGIIALWLQECPTLSPHDVMRVIAASSRRYDHTLTYPNVQYGYGQIHAMDGLRYIREHRDLFDALHAPLQPTTGAHTTYDLWGRPATPHTRGIVIENGRKIIR